MQHKHINLFLIILLSAACVFMTVNLVILYDKSTHLPNETVNSIVSILSENNIRIDPEIIPTKRTSGTVYVCNSGDYKLTVAQLLGQSIVESEYSIPNGSIIILDNGARFEFGDNFEFNYALDGSNDDPDDLAYVMAHASPVYGDLKEEISKIVIDFLDRGSREFDTTGMSIVTVVENITEMDGTYYVSCSRTIDGILVTDNRAICAVKDGEVTEAEGTWSFLTLGESYSAQLSDLFNILFHVRKEISAALNGEAKKVTIESIDLCYSLYLYGEKEDFCLIPCWQIVTDSAGNYIYNAINSTLYTIND